MKKYRKVQAKHFQKKTLNPSKKNIAQKLYMATLIEQLKKTKS